MSGKSHLYSYDPSDASWHYVKGNSANELSTTDATTHSKLDQIVTNTGSGGDASAANQVTGNASLSSIDSKVTACNTGAVVVSSGVVTETNSSTINSTLSSIDGKVTACDTTNVTITSSTLPTGAGTEAKQDDIITKLAELNDSHNTLEIFTTVALSFDNTTSKNTTNYSKYALVVNSDQSDTSILIQVSQNNTDWFHSEYPTSVNILNDADSVSYSQNNYITSGDCIAKYMRVRIYSPTGANVKVMFNLLH